MDGDIGIMRKVVVSGGGSGMGRAVTEDFVKRGDSVLILGRRADRLATVAEELGPSVEFKACDLTNPDDVARALEDRSSVDVLVNCAGGKSRTTGTDLNSVHKRWLEDFSTNVLTAVLLTEAVLPLFAKENSRLITVSSIAALRGNDSYGAAKSALHGWNHSMVARMAEIGGTANIVVPGYTYGTEFFGGGEPSKAELSRRAAESPLGRFGDIDDVVGAIAYLSSAQAGFVTGQFLGVNGGAILGR
ncbi:MAG: family oxidoreductase [Nocardia sp.]|nr:family oxidoreductase [Nocardia sp.]